MPTIIGKDNSKILQCVCRNCASILQYVPAEVQEEKHYDYTGGCDTYYFIICPCCGNKATAKKY